MPFLLENDSETIARVRKHSVPERRQPRWVLSERLLGMAAAEGVKEGA